MLQFRFQYSAGLIAGDFFGHYSSTNEDVAELQRLVGEIRSICKITDKTGLRILKTFWYRDNLCVLLYLGKKLEIKESEKRKLCTIARGKIRERMKSSP
jgi:hypothetical protein